MLWQIDVAGRNNRNQVRNPTPTALAVVASAVAAWHACRVRPICMCRLLLEIEKAARHRKLFICIRPVDRFAGLDLDGVTPTPWSH